MNSNILNFQNHFVTYIRNYEIEKLEILKPDLVNYLIICLVFFIIFFSKKRASSSGNEILNRVHTEQLRGLAIIFVVLGHLWVHLSKQQPLFVFSGDAVSLFLIISGFGLTISCNNKKIFFNDFCLKRVKRVLYPYWIVTLFILFFDYIILDRTLDSGKLILTFIGLNIYTDLRYLDYVRWFVTFILFWYIIFYIFILKYYNKYSYFTLFFIASILLPLDYYFLHLGWYQFFSFPLGCLLGWKYEDFKNYVIKNEIKVFFLAITGVVYIFIYNFAESYDQFALIIKEKVPNILLVYHQELNSMIMAFSFIILSGKLIEKGYVSSFLIILGKYSYEIFLIHGVFLVKYNFFIKSQEAIFVSIEFILYFFLVMLLSFLIYHLGHFIYDRKIK